MRLMRRALSRHGRRSRRCAGFGPPARRESPAGRRRRPPPTPARQPPLRPPRAGSRSSTVHRWLGSASSVSRSGVSISIVLACVRSILDQSVAIREIDQPAAPVLDPVCAQASSSRVAISSRSAQILGGRSLLGASQRPISVFESANGAGRSKSVSTLGASQRRANADQATPITRLNGGQVFLRTPRSYQSPVSW